jgi:Pyruvate/2-oxoacid:ferredoxin oxidoreductase delta subunit
MTVTRNIIEIDEDLCDGCGNCIISCAEGALEIVDGKARLVAEKYCDGLGACLGECPTGALNIVQRQADDFDEDAVEERLHELEREKSITRTEEAAGCPSATVREFGRPAPCQAANAPKGQDAGSSGLSHWPVQLRLIPPDAKFLANADLLITADCVPPAYPRFHEDFLSGRVVMLGCPKFDEVEHYLEKLTTIFERAGVQSVTTLAMEVPCCQGLPAIVRKARERAGGNIPLEEVVISTRGEILKRERHVA